MRVSQCRIFIKNTQKVTEHFSGTIVDFEEVEKTTFEFSSENTGPLSGQGSTDLWKYEGQEIMHVKNVAFWMS